MSRIEHFGPHTLYLGDCRDILPTLGKVDAVVTSPPYAEQREYGDSYDSEWVDVVMSLASVRGPDVQILVNLGLVHRNGEVVPYWQPFVEDMKKEGWRLFGWYVWDKLSAMPAGDMNRLSVAHEWVFHFNKASRKPTKWVRTKDRMIAGKGVRQADGSLKGITSHDKVGQELKISDSVFRLPPHQSRGGIEGDHPAVYPVALASQLTLSYSALGQAILDPFMGSGTTGVACQKLGRKFIGIEIEPKYFDIACRRLEQAMQQPDLFIPTASKPVQEALPL